MKLADSVIHRIVQIIQEGLLTGTDVSDHLRMVEVCSDSTDPMKLVLTEAYKQNVELQHAKMLAFAEQESAKRESSEN